MNDAMYMSVCLVKMCNVQMFNLCLLCLKMFVVRLIRWQFRFMVQHQAPSIKLKHKRTHISIRLFTIHSEDLVQNEVALSI